jgi:benzil reductase ((S)-benzoin forming)
MYHIIITGHSKGLGAGIATALLNEDNIIHGISRTENETLHKLATAKGCKLFFYPCDMSYSDTIPAVMQKVAQNIDKENTKGIFLVNNAGIIDPIGPVHSISPQDLELHLRINLLGPIFITREFIKLFQDWPVEKRVLNISSGSAVNPYYGWSAYCTGKAGLEMFARCLALEQEKKTNPVHTMSVAPGIIDTDMQTIIRATTEEQFIYKKKFVELKESGQLIAPNIAGKRIAQLLFSPEFSNGKSVDIRDSY